MDINAVYYATEREFIIHGASIRLTNLLKSIGLAVPAKPQVLRLFFCNKILGCTIWSSWFHCASMRSEWAFVNWVQISDCGIKMGLNGFYNGRIWFSNHLVRRKALLGWFSWVTEDGTFQSIINSLDACFSAILAALTRGRVCVTFRARLAALLGMKVEIRYSCSRRAFEPV